MADRRVLIETRGLTKRYGDRVAVDGIDLSISAGEVFGLLGPNGAGKTTTILMVLGLTEPTSGKVRVGGLDPTRTPLAVKRQVGYLPDTVGFYEDMTGRQNLRYTAALNELPRDEAENRIEERLEEVGLADTADLPVGAYSRGMKQRLGVADALLKDPKVVILDEPTASIDPQGVAEMQEMIRKLAVRDGRAVLLSSHLLHQVQQVCDRIAIFVEGRIIAEGTAPELASRLADGRSRFELRLDGPEDRVLAALRDGFDTEGVEAEEVSPGKWRITVPSTDARRLLPALVSANLTVLELRDLNADLDQIYRRYFREEVKA
ncbi:MAG: ABC transporter ATP-binding protein [Acidimicrobiia bacterium]